MSSLTFNNIVNLNDRQIQKMLFRVDFNQLGQALKNGPAEVKSKICSSLTQRAESLLNTIIDKSDSSDKLILQAQNDILKLF